MVMRAAIGNFEDSQTYGSMNQSGSDRRQFFTADIRSFALVALEIVSKMCEKKFVNMQYDWDIENNLETIHPNRARTPAMNGVLIDTYDSESESDSDIEEGEMVNSRSRRGYRKSHMSPAEVIEEIGRRSRSMSPGSRPMSAQSKLSIKSIKSRSRTVPPDMFRANGYTTPSSLYGSRTNTPCSGELIDDDVILPDDEYPADINMPSAQPVPLSHEQPRSQSEHAHIIPKFKSPSPSENVSGKRPWTPKKLSKSSENGSAFEAFAPTAKKSKSKSVQKTDSKKWSLKPSSIIKSITGAETSVSIFKSKDRDKDDSAEEVSDEEIHTLRERVMLQNIRNKRAESFNKGVLHRTSSKQSDQWSIPSDMEYKQHSLKNTVSADSRSSLWSNLPLPMETIDIEGSGEMDYFTGMIESLPGMTDPVDYSRRAPNLHDILEAKTALRSERKEYWCNDGPGPSQFVLVDYYDELQGVYVKKLAPKGFRRTMSGSQILPASVHRTYSGTQVLHKTNSGLHEILEQTEGVESEEENVANNNFKSQPVKKLKAKLLKDIPKKEIKEPIQEKPEENNNVKESKPTPAKRKSRSKSMKETKSGKHETVILPNPEEAAHNRDRARKALNKALKPKGPAPIPPPKPVKRENKTTTEEIAVKYASVKKIQTHQSSENGENKIIIEQSGTDCVSDRHSHADHQKPNIRDTENTSSNTNNATQNSVNVKRFHSFSSNDSCASSISTGFRPNRCDVSLTSGEMTSLSSQADPDTDEQTTDVDMSAREALLRKNIQRKAKMADSGFDSSSSEISEFKGNKRNIHIRDNRSKATQDTTIDMSMYGPGVDGNTSKHGPAFGENTSKYGSVYREPQNQFMQKRPAQGIKTVSIGNAIPKTTETAFCLTGFNSELHRGDYSTEQMSMMDNIETEYLPQDEDAGFGDECDEEDIFRPSSSMSRLIQVMSAPVDDENCEDATFENEAFQPNISSNVDIENVTDAQNLEETIVNIPQPDVAKTIHVKPTAISVATKSESRYMKDMRGPNVYASPTNVSRRYRELTQKGVPLRVSVVSASSSDLKKEASVDEKKETVNPQLPDNQTDDQKLFEQLEST